MPVTRLASLAYIIASLFNKGVIYLTLPIFTRLMNTTQIGVTTLFGSWQNILYPIVTLSLTSGSLNIALHEYKERRDEYQSVCLTLSTITGFVFLILVNLNINAVSKFTTLSSVLLWVLMILFIVNPALDIWYARQRYENEYKRVVIVSIITTGISMIAAIVSVWLAKKNGYTELGRVRVITQNSVVILIATIFYFQIIFNGKVLFDKALAKFALIISIPLVFHSLGKNILDISDRLMIGSMVGQAEAGIYGTVYGISSVALIFWTSINQAFIPEMFALLDEDNIVALNSKIKRILILFSSLSVACALIGPEIVMVLTTKEYQSAVYIIPGVMGGIYLTALYNIFSNFLLYKKRSLSIMVATLAASIINIILNYISILKFGYLSAAYTTLISFILLALFQGAMVKKDFGKHIIDFKMLTVVSLYTILSIITCNILYNTNIIRYIIIVLILLGIIKKRHLLVAYIKK